MSIEDVIVTEAASLERYVRSSEEPLLRAASSVLFSGDNPPTITVEDLEKSRSDNWRGKVLHGKFLQLTEGHAAAGCWDWLREAGLKKETESLIVAAQDQALPTRAHKVHVEKLNVSPLCRMCGQADETVMHLLVECQKLAQLEYKARHDSVAKDVHWALAKKYGFECRAQSYEHVPLSVMENTKCRLYWDFTIMCDRFVEHRRPDIVVHNVHTRHVQIVDIAVPGDGRVVQKEQEKRERYMFLGEEVKKLWNVSTCVVPVVVGCLGTVGTTLSESLQVLGVSPECTVVSLQKVALLGSAKILRRCLSM